MMKKFVFLISFVFLVICGYSQSSREVGSQTPRREQVLKKTKPKRGFFGLFKKKNLFQKTEKEEVVEFRNKMEKVYKAKAKEMKEMTKPQYSDPLYFGHKRPPKKRPLGKRKFCKECGMVH